MKKAPFSTGPISIRACSATPNNTHFASTLQSPSEKEAASLDTGVSVWVWGAIRCYREPTPAGLSGSFNTAPGIFEGLDVGRAVHLAQLFATHA
jgi:hypothetical protein